MTLHDSDALVLETSSAAEVLPDPTAVPQRTHILTNTGSAAAVWTATGGGTPYLLGGSAVASLTVPPGQIRQVQSDGTHWVVAPTAARRVFAASGVSDASGNAVFTFTPAFPSVPKVTQSIETANTNVTEGRVTALTTSSCTVNVRQSPAVVILGISVLQVPSPLVGATVHLHAIEAGQGV